MPQLIRQVVGVQAPHQVLRIVVVCIEPRQQQNKVGVAEADVLLPDVRDIVKVAAGGVVVDFVVAHCRVPCPKLSVPFSYGYMFSFQAHAASSCTEGLEVMRKKVIEALEHKIVNGLKPGEPDFSRLRMYDAVQFAADNMLDKLTVSAPLPSIALHPTCSMTHLGTQPAFEKIANAMSDDVYVPKHWGCCGYAGDRGMLHPELTASATEAEAAELSEQKQFAAYISANRTCEQGMTEATGHTYQNVLQLLERTTR